MKKILFVIAIIVLMSCDDDVQLRRSVFIHDPDAPGLPEYSEWGYNTFGAYYNRDVIVSNDIDVPIQVIQQSDATEFRFQGRRGEYYWSGDAFSITLTLHNFTPDTYQDLISLDETVIDLADENYSLTIKEGLMTYDTELLNGTFEIKRAQHLLVDGESEEVILSGVFEFQLLIDGEPVSISEGRFDVGVGSYNFFKYQ